MTPVLHPKTQQALQSVAQSGTHAILLTAPQGAGKETAAMDLARKLLQTNPSQSAYFSHIQPDGKSITIEQIRALQKFMQLKTTGSMEIRRVAILTDADTMQVEAQNALLKLLEEPPEDTVIILTASRPQQLRPTIHSRVQQLALLSPRKADAMDYFMGQGNKGVDIEKAYLLSNGQMGLMTALLDTSIEHNLTAHIDTAKQLYSLTAFERLSRVDELSKDKDALGGILFACKRICITALEQAALKNQEKAVTSWHKQLGLITKAEESLRFNPNAKLLLTDLFIQM